MIIFLKEKKATKLSDTVKELKRCFKHAKCKLFKEFEIASSKQNHSSADSWTIGTYDTSKYDILFVTLVKYGSVSWLHCEGPSHLEYIRPLISQRLQSEKKLDSFEMYTVKTVALQDIFQLILKDLIHKI